MIILSFGNVSFYRGVGLDFDLIKCLISDILVGNSR